MNNLSVVIPSKNAKNLVRCVGAIRAFEPDARIIVVDNDPTGAVYSVCMQYACTQIRWDKPFVFSEAVNAGIRASGDLDLVLQNDDALLMTSGGFQGMQVAAASHPDIGIIGATTNLTGQPEQRRLPEADPRYGLRETQHIAFVCVLIPARTRHHIAELQASGPSDAHMYSGGLLDERYQPGYGSEDLDYCMQVWASGLKVAVDDRCYVDHSSLVSSFRGLPTAAGDIWPNHRILRAKWGMPPNPADPEFRRLFEQMMTERGM